MHQQQQQQQQQLAWPAEIRLWDVHAYFNADDPKDTAEALKLHSTLQEKFPHMRLFTPIHRPVGPHPIAMWEGKLTSPEEFATILPWLALNRNGRSILVHPHTGNDLADHTNNCLWLGQQQPLILGIFRS
eukprot:TRINITY_DN3176_c0_g1_i1.p1 TRINITY_DN3176_c0_g1~~TRINITY_DN3176_c0_g1_i1.p1  ORF type:complete len:130 (-),score=37.12 TRINITY_DN3176_c0_g1_i1:16-405(-)